MDLGVQAAGVVKGTELRLLAHRSSVASDRYGVRAGRHRQQPALAELKGHPSLVDAGGRRWTAASTIPVCFLGKPLESARLPVQAAVFKTVDGALHVPWWVRLPCTLAIPLTHREAGSAMRPRPERTRYAALLPTSAFCCACAPLSAFPCASCVEPPLPFPWAVALPLPWTSTRFGLVASAFGSRMTRMPLSIRASTPFGSIPVGSVNAR